MRSGVLIRLFVAAGVAAAAIVGVGWSPAAAATHQVEMKGIAYSPASIQVAVGDTVTWKNTESSAVPHTVTADDGSFDSSPACPPLCMNPGDSYSRTFNAAGKVAYHCKIHASMHGTVSVGTGGSTTTSRASPTSTTTGPAGTATTAAGAARPAASSTTAPSVGGGAPALTSTTAAGAASATSAPQAAGAVTTRRAGHAKRGSPLLVLAVVATAVLAGLVGVRIARLRRGRAGRRDG